MVGGVSPDTFTAFWLHVEGRGMSKLTTGREIASRRRLKKIQKVKKSKSQKVFTFRLFGTFRLFDFSFFLVTFRLFGTFRLVVFPVTFRLFDLLFFWSLFDFSTFRFSGHFSGLFDFFDC